MKKIYTKIGDQGFTSLLTGTPVPKDHIRLQVYGTLDELNSLIGVILSGVPQLPTSEIAYVTQSLKRIQKQLFTLGSHLACDKEEPSFQLPSLESSWVTDLEKEIDFMTNRLPNLTSFIFPGGGFCGSHLHLARTVTRRAERWLISLNKEAPVNPIFIQYLNRLSDHLFVMARHVNHQEKNPEEIWKNS